MIVQSLNLNLDMVFRHRTSPSLSSLDPNGTERVNGLHTRIRPMNVKIRS